MNNIQELKCYLEDKDIYVYSYTKKCGYRKIEINDRSFLKFNLAFSKENEYRLYYKNKIVTINLNRVIDSDTIIVNFNGSLCCLNYIEAYPSTAFPGSCLPGFGFIGLKIL